MDIGILMDYGIDAIACILCLGVCFLIYRLYYYLTITRYAKKIEKAINEGNIPLAKEMLGYALKKQPRKKPFRKLQAMLAGK